MFGSTLSELDCNDSSNSRVNVASCIELGLLWFGVLAVGVVLSVMLLAQMQRRSADQLGHQRAEILVRDLGDMLERRLRQGATMPGQGELHTLLAPTMAHAPWLSAVDVFDASGVSLFNTDRGLVGERVPQAWLNAASGAAVASLVAGRTTVWRVGAENPVVGLPLRGSHGELAGHFSLTVRSLAAPPTFSSAPLLGGAALSFGVLAWLMVVRAMQARLRCRGGRHFSGVRLRLEQTATRLELTMARLSIDQRRVA